MNNLEFLDIPGYEGLYKINRLGVIIGPRGITLRPQLMNGYHKVVLYKNNKRTTLGLHQLLALTFIPNPRNFPQVNHKDENKLNNSLNNLEWCTAKYNCNYGTRTKRAFENGHLKSSITQGCPIRCLENNKIYYSVRDAARQLNVYHTGILKVLNGKYSQTGGYHFEYIKSNQLKGENDE